jgi:hypothetical protein
MELMILLVSSIEKLLGMFQESGFAPNFVVRVEWICRRNLEKLFHSNYDWRRRVSQELEKFGLSDVVENWLAWRAVK